MEIKKRKRQLRALGRLKKTTFINLKASAGLIRKFNQINCPFVFEEEQKAWEIRKKVEINNLEKRANL